MLNRIDWRWGASGGGYSIAVARFHVNIHLQLQISDETRVYSVKSKACNESKDGKKDTLFAICAVANLWQKERWCGIWVRFSK